MIGEITRTGVITQHDIRKGRTDFVVVDHVHFMVVQCLTKVSFGNTMHAGLSTDHDHVYELLVGLFRDQNTKLRTFTSVLDATEVFENAERCEVPLVVENFGRACFL
jgi:hypothetical protein